MAGAIVFGIDDGGKVNDFDCAVFEKFDPADLTNKVYKHTGQQFTNFKLIRFEKDAGLLLAMLVDGVPVPVVFSKPGTYDIGGRKAEDRIFGRHGLFQVTRGQERARQFR